MPLSLPPPGDGDIRRKSSPLRNPDTDSTSDSKEDIAAPAANSGLASKLAAYSKDFERLLIKYNLEARGVQRVLPHESHALTWHSYLQPFFFWCSFNLAAQNVTLGMLGPYIYGLSFRDASICAFFGSLIGSLAVSYVAIFGPVSGHRTLIFARYTFGWYPSKLLVILELIVLLGYSMIDLVIAGQILSAVSAHGSMSLVVGIVVVAIIGWLISTFGIWVFHAYQRYAFIPQLIAYSILYGVSSHNYDLSTPSQGDSRTVIGNRISFLSITLAAAITYAGGAADYFVYYPVSTPPIALFSISLVSLLCSFTFTYCLGIGLASAIPTVPAYGAANNVTQGALIVAGFTESTSPGNFNAGFGKFLAVVVALGLIANLAPPTYSSGIDFQVLGKNFQKIPRVIWNSVGVVIYTVCALAGRDHLAEIFTNFLALMGYWVIIWLGITLEEQFFFRSRFGFRLGTGDRESRRGWGQTYDWTIWNTPEKLPHGIAAFMAFLVGWAGAILCMAQVWYKGPIASLVGEYGADQSFFIHHRETLQIHNFHPVQHRSFHLPLSLFETLRLLFTTMLSLTSTLASLLLLIPSILAYEGDMTFYSTGMGSCGWMSSDNDDIVALSREIMGSGGDPNKNPKCGTKIGIWNPQTKTEHYATIVDTCQGCAKYDIDVSPALFKKVAPNGDGRVHGIDWGGPSVGG
ncbi:MAG: hypothetical protein LQ338_008099 [Usnochroma carphineum]|nr:MAG: hypothetical protein LQ338_008099 [Usnochroma carphineum]